MLEARNCAPYQFSSGEENENENLPARVGADALKDWCSRILTCVGMNRDDAEVMAYILVETDLMGVDTHGVLKFPMSAARKRAATTQKQSSRSSGKPRRLRFATARAAMDRSWGGGLWSLLFKRRGKQAWDLSAWPIPIR